MAQNFDESIIDRVKKATVFVATFASKRQKADTGISTGSGYFVNSTGLLITNNHVIDPAHGKSLRERQAFQYGTNRLTYKIIIESGTDQEKIWECELLHQSVTADQAILQARDENGKLLHTPNYLRLLPSWRLKNQIKVCAFGFPGGNSLKRSRHTNAEISLSPGMVTRIPRAPSGRVRRIETDVAARPGNSGGPMVDAQGFIVGTVTLMGQAQEQANMSALVPGALTRAVLRDAIVHERIPSGSDLTPFFDILAEAPGGLNIPEFKRLPDRDVLFLDNDERIYGTINDQTILWKSSLGDFEIPTSAIAYIMRQDDRHILVLESGNSLIAREVSTHFNFTLDGGSQVEKSISEINRIAIRSHEKSRNRPRGDVVVLSSDAGRLILVDVKGKAKLESGMGVIEVGLQEISRIEPEADGTRQVVILHDGRRITGRFQNDIIEAKLASTATTIHFDLSHVTHARIDTLGSEVFSSGGLHLLNVINSTDPEIVEIARAVEHAEFDQALSKLKPFLVSKRMTRMPSVMKDQVRLLDGMIALRTGKADAKKKFRKCVKAKDPNLAAYARGCVETLKRFDGSYEGAPLSDPHVFQDAGLALGKELIRAANTVLQDRQHLQSKRGEYHRYMNAIRKHEKAMEAASVFAGPEADEALVKLWKFAVDLCEREYGRLIEEYEKVLRGRRRVSRADAVKLQDIVKKIEKVADNYKLKHTKLRQYGFHYSEKLDLESIPK